ncbi:uncharacterized protein LOC128559421 [Mercenaria mercenaria]|uniref:uncharacterized protein LOC128559421 n=1 Tax=Mercenaria mercenaria TaxID=6596 RepID=UPI00234F1F72|nr:uncharacterized protein LOC128559421 [Mercenaria mercenaria]
MSDYSSKLADKGFCNWIKANLAISVTKNGLQDVVCNKLQAVHQDVLNSTRTDDQIRNNIFCSDCTTQSIIHCSTKFPCNSRANVCPFHEQAKYRECPNRICDRIRDKIEKIHVFNKPSWKNTRAEAWCNSYWEYAKCFMPPCGYSDKPSFSETDFNGIISIVTNESSFASQIDTKDVCEQARSIVNAVRHNSDLSVSDQRLEDIVTVLQQFLSCCEEFKYNTRTSQARLKLEELKGKSFSINEGDVKECMNDQYEDLLKDLKADLIQFNKDVHGTTSISMAIKERDFPLQELYVPPIIHRVHSGNTNESDDRRTTPVATFKDIFFGCDGRYREIYLCSDAGLGKTVYGKRLALMWCQANEADQKECNFTREEIDVMKSFGFVFFISLKETDQTQGDVDDMIVKQIISHLARVSSYRTEFVERILTNETCLIILDGLDEWSHSTEHIPHRKSRKTCTFFTTTRSWKFTIAKIRQSKIDQQLEMAGIDAAGKQKLMFNVLKVLTGDSTDDESASQLEDFNEEIAKRHIVEFETTPMLLLYLICLWFDKKPLGDSRCSLYSNIVEMLLQEVPKPQKLPELADENKSIPKCFEGNEHCCTNFRFIEDLAYLAFKTCFNKKTETKYVFTDVIAKNYMSEQCLEFWLRTGILTQVTRKIRLTTRDISVSFIHNTFHEFFAALHLALGEPDVVTDAVRKACRDLNSILQNAGIFVFLCGLSPATGSMILNSLSELLANDELTQRLRKNTYVFLDYWEICDLKQDFQNMMVTCVNESKDNGYISNYHLEDIFLNFDSEPKKRYISALCDLTEHKNVKSVKFGRSLVPGKVLDLHKILNVQNMISLQKLDLWGQPDKRDVEILLQASPKTLTCLLLHGCEMKGTRELEKHIEISEDSFDSLQTLVILNSIDLYCISLKHELIRKILTWLEERKCMKQIKVARIKCLDHPDYNCNSDEFIFDLSEHKHLDIVGVGDICVADVKVNSLALQEFWAGGREPVVTSFLTSYAPSAIKLHTLVLEFIDSAAVVECILNKLPYLDGIRYLQLKDMDLQEREVILTKKQTVKHLRLIELKMESRALNNLIEALGTYNNPVTVEIASCDIRPDKNDENICFENIRDMIDNKFTVITNLRCSGHDNAFAFRTVSSDRGLPGPL